jgi:hypothetical protein
MSARLLGLVQASLGPQESWRGEETTTCGVIAATLDGASLSSPLSALARGLGDWVTTVWATSAQSRSLDEESPWQPSPGPTTCREGAASTRTCAAPVFVGAHLSGVVMRGAQVEGADIDAPWLCNGESFLRVNDVDVIPFVEAESTAASPGSCIGLG